MIVHITPSYKPAYIYGGTTASVSSLCESLCAEGCATQVLCTTANGRDELDADTDTITMVDGVRVFYCRRLTKDPTHISIALLRRLYKMARNEPMLMLHIHSWWNFTAICALFMAKLLGLPAVLSPRGMLSDYTFKHGNTWLKNNFHRLIGKWLLQYPLLHATSWAEQQDILQTTGNANIAMIPNLVHFPDNCPDSGNRTAGSCFKLLFLSRIQHKKGLELLFHAVQDLPFAWQLTIAGTGNPAYISRLRRLAGQLNIAGSIHWTGHIGNDHKYHCMAGHDLLVLPSHNENFGNVVLEALLSGTPVLVSEEVGLSAYIRDNDLGWLSPLNKTALTQTIMQACTDTSKRNHIRQVAPVRIRQDFNEKQLIGQYRKLYGKFA